MSAAFICDAVRTPIGRHVCDTTIGWRFVNPKMKKAFGIDSMPETADNVAEDFQVGRADQDASAARSQARWAAAQGMMCIGVGQGNAVILERV